VRRGPNCSCSWSCSSFSAVTTTTIAIGLGGEHLRVQPSTATHHTLSLGASLSTRECQPLDCSAQQPYLLLYLFAAPGGERAPGARFEHCHLNRTSVAVAAVAAVAVVAVAFCRLQLHKWPRAGSNQGKYSTSAS